VIRRLELSVPDLYDEHGQYRYGNGFNERALIALAAGVLVALIGNLNRQLGFLFSGAWFSATVVAFVVYLGLMRLSPRVPHRAPLTP
jgi:NCS1 family nucleobase:cation symporter-1